MTLNQMRLLTKPTNVLHKLVQFRINKKIENKKISSSCGWPWNGVTGTGTINVPSCYRQLHFTFQEFSPTRFGKMAEDPGIKTDPAVLALIDQWIADSHVMIFSKTTCPWCAKAKEALKGFNVTFDCKELNILENGEEIQKGLLEKTGQKTVPNIFINQEHIGGFSDLNCIVESGVLEELIAGKSNKFDYDVVVIGGGSGGIAAAKEAKKFGKKVAICDFVKPSPRGSTWGVGGTCVNVGCIPKKLMHRASLIHHDVEDAPFFGWKDAKLGTHDWPTLVENVNNYIRSLNFAYRKAFRKLEITYINGYGEFIDNHNLKVVDNKNKEQTINSRNFIIATGLRPYYPNIPGAKEYCISSDDIFLMQNNPGKTLIVGASYIALECAGFLAGLGIECSVMVRSILLRGFDQEIATKIGENLESLGVSFLRQCVPTKVEKLADGNLKVEAIFESGVTYEGAFQTVMFATGREATTDGLHLYKAGVVTNPRNKKIPVDAKERTNTTNIFAVGDVADLDIELTPVAIQAGKLLAHRLYGGKSILTDYTNIPTTVFTPLEYGCVGYSEEKALELFKDDIEVFHNAYTPLESVLSDRFDKICFAKIICLKTTDQKLQVIGMHVLGPNAGEIIQGFAIAVKMGATKDQLDSLIGIHPTSAEVFTTMSITKSSGQELEIGGC